VVASVRSCQKLSPCPMEPMPAGSKTDLPLAKAKPISDGGSTSGITHLRRQTPPLRHVMAIAVQPERGVRRCERKKPCKPQGQ